MKREDHKLASIEPVPDLPHPSGLRQLLVCTHQRSNPTQPCCARHHAPLLMTTLQQWVRQQGWPLRVVASGCLGRCAVGPSMKLAPGGPFITYTTEAALEATVKQFLAETP